MLYNFLFYIIILFLKKLCCPSSKNLSEKLLYSNVPFDSIKTIYRSIFNHFFLIFLEIKLNKKRKVFFDSRFSMGVRSIQIHIQVQELYFQYIFCHLEDSYGIVLTRPLLGLGNCNKGAGHRHIIGSWSGIWFDRPQVLYIFGKLVNRAIR